jgi:SAM-dependent methyltransferase
MQQRSCSVRFLGAPVGGYRELVMGRDVRLRELLVAIEGLALLRDLYDGTDHAVEQRLAEVRRVLDDDSFLAGEFVRETSARQGYRAWSGSYDDPGNPVIALEEPAVWSLVDSLPPGRALDAACGTGRHARHLVEHGHEVLGVDVTPEMIDRARIQVPQARFLNCDLRSIPTDDGHFDLVVCGLAVGHLADLHSGVAELARVLRPGGRLMISVLHPFQAHLGWHARFVTGDGERAFVREHAHTHADYLESFRSARLNVRDCLEPTLTADHARAQRRAFDHFPDATIHAYVGLPAVLVWDVEKGPRE